MTRSYVRSPYNQLKGLCGVDDPAVEERGGNHGAYMRQRVWHWHDRHPPPDIWRKCCGIPEDLLYLKTRTSNISISLSLPFLCCTPPLSLVLQKGKAWPSCEGSRLLIQSRLTQFNLTEL